MAFPHRMAALPRLLNPLVLPLTRRVPPLAVLHREMTRAGRRYRITRPRRVGREALQLLPALASLEMRAVGIDEFLLFDVAPPDDRR
jgi:hypothetical protein